jgi:ribulose-5-phosphate 4-epimerase/fuculose-1-phosphate aldolase
MAHTLARSASTVSSLARSLDSEAVSAARQQLAACFQLAALHGLEEGICNHFSAVVPGHDDLFFVNPYGYAFNEITASRLLICDYEGNVIDGEGEPEATAFFIHARVHKLMPRVKAAFHTHMPFATALCMIEGPPLLWLGQTALKFYGRTAVDEDYNGLALDVSEGDRIAHAMGDADILFLKNHGVMVAGASIAEAWDDLYYLERAAEAQLRAMSSNRPLKPVPHEVAQRCYEQMRAGDVESARAHLASGMRQLRARGVDYAA